MRSIFFIFFFLFVFIAIFGDNNKSSKSDNIIIKTKQVELEKIHNRKKIDSLNNSSEYLSVSKDSLPKVVINRDYDKKTIINYKDYNSNIRYPAKNELMDEFRNKLKIKNNNVVIIDYMMLNDHVYKNISWEKANFYCHRSTFKNFNDWKLPTIDELEKLYDNLDLIFNKSMIFWSSNTNGVYNHNHVISYYTYQGISFDGQYWTLTKEDRASAFCIREF